jgi:hypothetical protein
MSAPAVNRRTATSVTSPLEVSRYDQVAGSLVSVLIVMGVLVVVMFLLWLASLPVRIPTAAPVRVLEDVGGGGFGDTFTPGMQREFFEPTIDEVPLPPSTESSSVETIADSLAAVSTVVSSEAPTLDYLEGPSGGHGRGSGEGMGDGTGRGPGGPGTSDGIPAWERWEVRMSAERIDEYAKQLDYFGVELGVAGGGNPNVDYITSLAAARPKVRVGAPKDEKRLRFLHRSGELRQADRELAAKAGVNTTGRVVCQFYSPQMYQRLLTLENERMGKRRIREVRRTVFGVKRVGAKYEFFVISQEYRSGV